LSGINLQVRRTNSDQRLLLGITAAMLILIVVVSLLAPQSAENDPQPSTYNAGPQGARAAYLLFQRLGRPTSRWDRPVAELAEIDASRTTLLLAEPAYAATDQKELAEGIEQFLEHGGRVLATGPSGALLLPGGATKAPGVFQTGLCSTTPEGPGPLARAGSVGLVDQEQWASDGAQFRVAQRCGADAVVVDYPVAAKAAVGSGSGGANLGSTNLGEVVWWSSATPLTNAGLKQDSNLRLLLASVGPGRAVVFDEALHRQTASMWDAAKGLPLRWLGMQAAALFLLLVLSFSRRRGPVRSPVTLPRSSPLEFAASMGDLYEKAGASSAAVDAARRRLVAVLTHEFGTDQGWAGAVDVPESRRQRRQTGDTLQDHVAEMLRERVGGDWSSLADHLRVAEQARQKEISPHSALALVQALHHDADAVKRAFAPTQVKF
jgi:hypothetical protein